MQIQKVQNNNYNNPNFGAFRVSNSPEMKVAKQILKQNCPEFYDSLMSGCEKALKGTRYFDGFLDIENGKLVMRLQHQKNLALFGEPNSAIRFDEQNFYPRLDNYSKEIEFSTREDGILRLRKLNENENVVNYTVKDITYGGEWSDKASTRQAELIKKLDDNMKKVFIG